MNLHANTLPKLSALALCLVSASLLPACGGGSVGGMTRTPPPPLDPPPPPTVHCPEPVLADCVVDVPAASGASMFDGRQSDYALIKQGAGSLGLDGDFRFSGGTTLEEGRLSLSLLGTLQSDVTVQTAGHLELEGTVIGDVVNHGELTAPASIYEGIVMAARIDGDYTQSNTGRLNVVFGGNNGGTLQVSGRADIDGTLQLQQYSDAWGPYGLPSTPYTHHVLHAGAGVFGQFSGWTSPGLFIAGSLRYLSNDIYFDATSISAQRVMAGAKAGDALTLESAGNFDGALVEVDALMALPDTALTATQREFLGSTASIQRIRDYRQAARTFDSLSGHGHRALVDSLLQGAVDTGARSSRHARGLRPGAAAGAWSAGRPLASAGSGTIDAPRVAGYDQWLGDRLLLGASFGWNQHGLRLDRSGGNALGQSPQWNLYLHRRGDNGAYAMGDVGYSRQQLDLDRPIDLGAAAHRARSRRGLEVTHAYVEAGRELRLGEGRLTSFIAMSHAMARSEGFLEQGNTGFELMAHPSLHRRTSGDLGLGYARRWDRGGERWLRLDLGAGYRRLLAADDDMHAAFTGAPALEFTVQGLPRDAGGAWLELGLAGGSSDRWSWLLSYDHRSRHQELALGVELDF